MKPEKPSTKAAFQWDDPMRFDDLLSDDEKEIVAQAIRSARQKDN